MAGALEDSGVECHIRDYPALDGTWEDLRSDLTELRPDALLISITTPTLAGDLNAAAIAKEIDPEIRTISKGAHFFHQDIETLSKHPELDLVMRGEYEGTVVELAQEKPLPEIPGITYQGPEGPVRTANRAFTQNLDSLPFPARHLVDNSAYFRPDTGDPQATIITCRGCPYPCVFCLAGDVAGKKVRLRSPENVLAEIRQCVERHDIRDFLFRSDLFTANRKWVLDLCKAIIESGLDISWSCNSRVDTIDEDMLRTMKSAGCWLIAFGVESGSADLLKRMKKGTDLPAAESAIHACRSIGIKTSVYFVIGLPWETRQTFEESVQFAKDLNPDFLEVFYAYPFYGTEFYRVAVEEGLLRDGEIPLQGYNHPSCPSIYLSLEQLEGMRTEFLRSFYLRPKFVIRTLLGTRSPKVLKNYVKYGCRQLRDFFHA